MKNIISVFITIILCISLANSFVYAKETELQPNRYVYDKSVDAGNNKYSESNKIESGDQHFGWKLGNFTVSGFTDRVYKKKKIVFLKNVGDKVELSFTLLQNIKKLNNDPDLSISSDDNGSDEVMGIPKTDFKHGALIVKKTNHENETEKPIVYIDYLNKKAKLKANKRIGLYEEGDYEVSLDYEIKDDSNLIFKEYPNYKMHFKFSIRNSNAMIFLRDLKTKSFLEGGSYTENGFYIDFAKSKYLHVNVKRDVLNKGSSKLTTAKDTKFNGAAKNGNKYTKEGIYTITVQNYTGGTTEKIIYVGDNKILKTAVVTGMPVQDVKEQVKQGSKLKNDGEIEYAEPTNKSSTIVAKIIKGILMIMVIGVVIMVILMIKKKRKSKGNISFEDIEEPIEFEKEE